MGQCHRKQPCVARKVGMIGDNAYANKNQRKGANELGDTLFEELLAHQRFSSLKGTMFVAVGVGVGVTGARAGVCVGGNRGSRGTGSSGADIIGAVLGYLICNSSRRIPASE